MKLRTILLFGILALVFSLPMLRSGNLLNRQKQGPFENIATSSGAYGNDAYGNAVSQQPKKTRGFLARLFGGSSPSDDSNNVAGQSGDFNRGGYSSVPAQQAGFAGQPAISEPVYTAFFNLAEFLRFDLTPNWIRSKWPRVSLIQGLDQLTGMRVALVSGPRPSDIHGSLTYFFDNQQRIQRICFKGWTGDSREIVQLVQQMGFTRQKSNAAGYFVKRSWGKSKGALRLDYPPVIRRELANEQLMVLFEFVNPSSSLSVSNPTQTILNAMESSR